MSENRLLSMRLSRRELLTLAAISPLALLTRDETSNQVKSIDRNIQIGNVPGQQIEIPSGRLEALDTDYFAQLLQELQLDSRDENAKQPLANNLSWVIRSSSGAGGSAFQIDESGYYITARHVLTDNDECAIGLHQRPLIVFNPNTGRQDVLTSFSMHPSQDLAIAYAPTGKARKRMPNITLDLTLPQNGEYVFMEGLYKNVYDSKLFRRTAAGVVNTGIREGGCSPELLAVAGLIPYGGNSGSPVYNEAKRIVAIETSFYPLTASQLEDYRGARVQPLAGINGTVNVNNFVLDNGRYVSARR